MTPPARTPRTRVAAIVAAGVATVAVAAGCGGAKETAATDGPTIFAESGCANCHAFAAADAKGRVGPDLDRSTLTADEVAEKVRGGGGGMPSFDNLSDEQLRALAEFVVGERGR